MHPLLVVSTALLLLSSTAAAVVCDAREKMTTRVNPLYYECCAKARQYKDGDSYHGNLTRLVGNLLRNISASEANYFASDKVDLVYGFVLCCGDYPGAACARSLNQTIQDAIVNRFICPFYKDVAVYYDQVTFGFSGDEFLYDNRSNQPAWVASNMNFVNGSTGDAAARYGELIKDLMKKMAEYAARNSSNLYATGMSWFGEEAVSVLHGMVQCRPDLDKHRCQECLGNLTNEIPKNFHSSNNHHVGGRILALWCSLRFEKDLFFAETSETIKLNWPEKGPNKPVIIVSSIAGGLLAVIIISGSVLFIKRKRDLQIQNELEEWTKIITTEIGSTFSLFTLNEIRYATDNFSEAKRLGQGAFGPVYRGQLRCGVAAIKRLAVHSRQGLAEFRNEIRLIANLQHVNLVKLIGCCIQHNENILVYEYMSNKSLDDVFSDVAKWASLTWSKCQNIINGIAQGLLYIHNYSQFERCIVHRDLKANNILLDSEMNPKISDFGIARMFDSSVTELHTTRLMGTRGYMAPEYFFGNTFSIKSDVFSFGVLILEIISGRKVATSFCRYKRSNNLMAYAWRLWEDRNCKQLIDNSLSVEEPDQEAEIIRCSQIALLCVQAKAEDRPDMKEVAMMLSNKDIQLNDPKQPSYFNEPIMNIVAASSSNNISTEYHTATHVHPMY